MSGESSGVLLPGREDQLNFLLRNMPVAGKKVLLIGSGAEKIAMKLAEENCESILILTDNEELLVNTRMIVTGQEKIKVKYSSFAGIDSPDGSFDIVYAQGTISNMDRKKILKEVYRVLGHEGFFVVGEMTSLKGDIPAFLRSVFAANGMEIVSAESLEMFYKGEGFKLKSMKVLDNSLKEYYKDIERVFNRKLSNMTKQEQQENKELITKTKHEINVFLKLGGLKYIGFSAFILLK